MSPLDAEIAAWLVEQDALPPRSSLTIEETRERMRGMAAGSHPQMERVENVDAGGVAARQYWPAARQYWPKDDASLPLLVFFHGGRFISGDLESHDGFCRWLADACACRVLAVDYRLAPEHPFPAAAEDAAAATRWALTQSSAVGVAGDSAGGNLAAVAALEIAGLRCQLLIYPMLDATRSAPSHAEFAEGFGPGTDDMERGWALYAGDGPRESPRISPLYCGDLTNLPSTLIQTAEYDTLRDEGEVYGERLRAAGNSVMVVRYAGSVHGFVTLPGRFELARQAISDAGLFVRDRMALPA
ncbi:MAG: alpha/beta hydrolase [Bryobacteraceae bacterium]|nr:alpha/beta hydrolase [Bryobacteraceae bacterium]